MNNTEPKKTLSLTHSFDTFVESYEDLSQEEKEYIIKLFEHPHIKKVVRVSMILVVWALIYSSVDGVILSFAVIDTAVGGFDLTYYLLWFFITLLNFILKLIFLNWFDSEKYLTRRQKLLGSVPSFGVILFTADVFEQEKLFLKTLRQYLIHIRKKGVRFILSLLSKIPF